MRILARSGSGRPFPGDKLWQQPSNPQPSGTENRTKGRPPNFQYVRIFTTEDVSGTPQGTTQSDGLDRLLVELLLLHRTGIVMEVGNFPSRDLRVCGQPTPHRPECGLEPEKALNGRECSQLRRQRCRPAGHRAAHRRLGRGQHRDPDFHQGPYFVGSSDGVRIGDPSRLG